MFGEALKHFSNNALKSPSHPDYIHVSGVQYWRYRVEVEGLALAVAYIVLIACAYVKGPLPGELHVPLMYAAIATFFLGALELWRVVTHLSAQKRFDVLFYG